MVIMNSDINNLYKNKEVLDYTRANILIICRSYPG